MYSYQVQTTKVEEMVCIDDLLIDALKKSKVEEGMAFVFTPHTTAAITINENADEDVQTDMLYGLRKLAPNLAEYLHMEGNSPAHIRSSLIGAGEFVMVENTKPCLGRWQALYLMEFDGPRSRQVWIRIWPC